MVWLVLALLAAIPATAGGFTGRVVHVAAGDRLKVDTGGKVVALRLAHVRAPRRDHFYWARARRGLGDLVFGRLVSVQPLRTSEGLVEAAVTVDGSDVAGLMVSRGLLMTAANAPPDLELLEAAARRQGRGIWGSGVIPGTGGR